MARPNRMAPYYGSMLRIFHNLEGFGLFCLPTRGGFGVPFQRLYTMVSVLAACIPTRTL